MNLGAPAKTEGLTVRTRAWPELLVLPVVPPFALGVAVEFAPTAALVAAGVPVDAWVTDGVPLVAADELPVVDAPLPEVELEVTPETVKACHGTNIEFPETLVADEELLVAAVVGVPVAEAELLEPVLELLLEELEALFKVTIT